ncbi:sugar ABC transporter permease, partial [Rhizobium ruizarguesonis]
MTISQSSIVEKAADATARATPVSVARRVRGLSDRAIAWLFIAPA